MADNSESSATILVVDDIEDNRVVLGKLLRPKGYQVFSAATGEEALSFVEATPPDLILLDLIMPGMDGFEVCERLKKSPKTRHIPIIIITGLAEKEAYVRCLEAGADDFLAKPFDAVLLSARMRSSLRAKKLQDQILEYQLKLEEYNRTLEQRVRERTTQVTRTQEVAIFSLAKLSESRDTETGAHLERMRSYARETVTELAGSPAHADVVTEDFVVGLYLSSPLHDIGKVGIPDYILLKPGKLTPEEFDIMKVHSLIGGDTLKAADEEAGGNSFLAMGRDIAYWHHERWDGKGYPHGLAGTDIPLSARIVSVSDVYDALTSKRPYKEPFSHEQSKAIIVEGRGSQFDPDVVDAFLAREENIIAIRAQLQDSEELSRSGTIHQVYEKYVART